ncbi:MAG: helix-turn-helix domain-containing protein [bacterium]|nr:helix-turn-helix domain-containing protein [bacterium]
MIGYSWQKVAEISETSRQTIHSWVRKWNQNGKEELVNKSGGSKLKVRSELKQIDFYYFY